MELSEFRKFTDGVWNEETRCYRGWNRDVNVQTVDVYRVKDGEKSTEYSAGIYCEEIDGDFEEWLLEGFFDDRHATVCKVYYRKSAELEIDYHSQSVDVVDFGEGDYNTTYIITTAGEVVAY